MSDSWRPFDTCSPLDIVWVKKEEQEDMKDVHDRAHEETSPFPFQQKDEAALRYDAGKVRYHLLPVDFIREMARIYERGAAKYAPRNWEKGMSYSRIYDSFSRHVFDGWMRGESIDPDDGQHHLLKAIWNLYALYYYEKHNLGTDDLERKKETE